MKIAQVQSDMCPSLSGLSSGGQLISDTLPPRNVVLLELSSQIIEDTGPTSPSEATSCKTLRFCLLVGSMFSRSTRIDSRVSKGQNNRSRSFPWL